MECKVGVYARFEESNGSEFTISFGPRTVCVHGKEFQENGKGPEGFLDFSYGVHPATCPALAYLASVINGNRDTLEDIPFDKCGERAIVRKCDNPIDQIVLIELGPDRTMIQVQGSYDRGMGDFIKTGGTMPRLQVLQEDAPEVFQAIRHFKVALMKDNKNRPYPDGWWLQ